MPVEPSSVTFPAWVFRGLLGIAYASVLASALAVVATMTRRWLLARRLGGLGFLLGIGPPLLLFLVFVFAFPSSMSVGEDAANRAVVLAGILAELMNASAPAPVGIALGAAMWLSGLAAERRAERAR